MISKLILQDHLNVISNVLNTYKELKIMNTNKNKILNVEITTEEQRNELVKQLQEMEFKKELPKSWEELDCIKGYFLNSNSEICFTLRFQPCIKVNNNLLKTEKQAKKALAMAQLSQLMSVYNDGWEPEWGDSTMKYGISRHNNKIYVDALGSNYHFLTFKTKEITKKFLKNFEPLIRQFFELD